VFEVWFEQLKTLGDEIRKNNYSNSSLNSKVQQKISNWN
jgi:hypothetical protein